MTFVLKGFPTEISDYIELPDIAELLTYPFFFDTHIDDAYKYGSPFQRKLIDMTPLRGTKNVISVLSEVRFIAPSYRSCTTFGLSSARNPDLEWHIDCEEEDNHVYHEERDIVHLLSNDCTCLTEFNESEIALDIDPSDMDYLQFTGYIVRNLNKLGIKGKKMPTNRIVTFTNHLHRATDPKRIEFRYMFRIVETDRKREPARYDPSVNCSYLVSPFGKSVPNIEHYDNKIVIHIPEKIDLDQENTPQITKLPIHDVFWGSTGLDETNPYRSSNNQNMIMLAHYGDYSKREDHAALLSFFKKMDRYVQLVSADHIIEASLTSEFYFEDPKLGKVAGTHILLTEEQVKQLQPGQPYQIAFNEHAHYSLTISPTITFKK